MSGELIVGMIALAITIFGLLASAIWWASALYKQVFDMAKIMREMKDWLVSLEDKHNSHELRITVLEEKVK